MIQEEAKQIIEDLEIDLIELGLNYKQEKAIIKLIAKKLKEKTNDAVYQYVINQLSE